LFDFRALAGTAMLWMALGGTSQAYVRTRSLDDKYNLVWANPRVRVTVYTGGMAVVGPDDFVAAAIRAAATWSAPQIDTSVEFVMASSPDAREALRDQENTITFRTSSWDYPPYPPQALALTTSWVADSQILETDTEINAVDPRFHWAILSDDPATAALSTEIDLQNALTHELGHVLGLAHPCNLKEPANPQFDNTGQPVLDCADPTLPADVLGATMYPTAKPGSIGERTLSPDEMMALRDLYPAGRAPIVEGRTSVTSVGCSVASEPGRGAGAPAVLTGAMLAWVRRRRGAVTRGSGAT
jgi:MYXO-CTERM domain-containing protein